MPSRKLFVFEGKKPEVNIIEAFPKIFSDISSNENTVSVYGNNIYHLYKEIKEDKYLDIFKLLKEKGNNKEALEGFDADDFSGIYLFFDHDGHDIVASDNKLSGLFDNETECGKLYISYPMAEALKHFSDKIDFKNLTAPINENKSYKKNVDRDNSKEYKDFRKYDHNTWVELIKVHLKKGNFIVNDTFSLPTSIFSQGEILSNQQQKYINPNCTVAVLSAFPVFLLDYYGAKRLSKKLDFEEN